MSLRNRLGCRGRVLTLVLVGTLPSLALAQAEAPRAGKEKARQSRSLPDAALQRRADDIIQAKMEKERIPGLVLGIVRNGRPVVARGYGEKVLGGGERPDTDTVFSIGSLSKALTGYGALRLVDQRRLRLEDAASRYVQGMPPAWRALTVHQFLTHTSGIPSVVEKRPTFQETMQSVEGRPLRFTPGERQAYNNFNFAVTGQVIEAASGLPYLEFMRRHVFQPLGMKRSGYPAQTRNAAVGYSRALQPVEVRPKGGDYAVPSGFLSSTLNDLVRFHADLEGRRLMRPATYEALLRPVVFAQGRQVGQGNTPGFHSRKAGDTLILYKNGGADGFVSQFHFIPGTGNAVIALCNRRGGDLKEVITPLMEAAFGIPAALNDFADDEDDEQP